MRVLVFGEILWDIIEGEAHLGGAPLNFAAHVRKCGFESGIISALGVDQRGSDAFERISKLGVDISLVQQNEKPTGYVPVTLNNGQPSYEIIEEVAFDYISADLLGEDSVSSFDTFYFGSLIQRNKESSDTLYHILDNYKFREIFYDVNLRKDCYSKEIISRSLDYCTLLKVNDEEVEEISTLVYGEVKGFEDFCEHVIEQNPKIKTVIITAGKEGCYVFDGQNLHQVETDPVKVVDTVGAGDSFSAAFLCTYYRTSDPVKSASVANRVGGFVASSAGPIPDYSPEILRLVISDL